MKNTIKHLLLVTLAVAFSVSCQTTYDPYGNPVQSVDPTTATAGVVAAGLLGAAIANNNNRNRNVHHVHHGARPYHHHHRGHRHYRTNRRVGYHY